MKIINISIEPLEERYSNQWNRWFLNEFARADINFETVLGDKSIGTIRQGSFLDIIDTNVYKTSQLAKIIRILEEYDDSYPLVLFFHDIWFPGITNIAYIRDGLGLKNLTITGCLHAGTYDPHDFLTKKGMKPWGSHLENSIFEIVDMVFVATLFHRNLVRQTNIRNSIKIHVTGFPIFDEFSDYQGNDQNIIIFPHRLDSEKNPDTFDTLKEHMKINKVHWIKTVQATCSKKDYYHLLNQSKIAVSFADQETWGIAMQEAVLCGCIPLVPDRLSYSEMYEPNFKYSSLDEAEKMIWGFLETQPTKALRVQQENILRKGRQAIPNMIRLIKQYIQL